MGLRGLRRRPLSGVDDALEHARRLLTRPASYSQMPTDLYETIEQRAEEATLQSPVPGAPTMPGRGATDHDASAPGRASKITAAVEVLIRAVEQLRDEVRAVRPAVDLIAAEHRDLRSRHDQLVDVVQTHRGRLDEIDEALLEIGYQRWMIRTLLIAMGGVVPAVGATLVIVTILVLR